ncbi:putative sulfoacetate transporter SauU [Corynebacterium occultum]|uniref:Lysosomal dipeptide transporter MFSD1 n=1 Tax=Corynebacterium occultum TaxID=2675219 RepID=A0A6B8WNF3_9CORY|nr:MFS transporter [Corynebacterium occultum]QGU07878.1 putative sulfoacetate transporter SauU [Corynebacterium occultum]
MSSPDPRTVLTRRAITVWVAAVAVYVVAITGRTSFGVAGVEAIERFGIDASRIAVFTAVQIGVYAFAQIPMGMLIDRFGPRKMLVAGAVVMGAGQILLGLTGNYWVAILARVLIGAGDASAFLSVMRILPYWFPLKKTPLFTQLTASLGQLGQFISAVPFMALLHLSGWTVAFVSLGAVGVLIAMAAGVAVADSPDTDDAAKQARAEKKARRAGEEPPLDDAVVTPREPAQVWELLKMVLRSPVCWLGFFIHYSCMLPQIVFTLLWGVPMMILGMGLSSAQAALVLTLNTVATVSIGPLLGLISSRLGQRRELGALAFTLIIGATWIIFFMSETPRGLMAIIIVNIIVAMCTPAANFGFDHVRERLDRKFVATGTGLSNMGGFLSGMLAAQLVGVLLDWSAQGKTYAWADFRIAWIAVIVVWALGVIGLLISRSAMLRSDRGRGRGTKVVEHTEV